MNAASFSGFDQIPDNLRRHHVGRNVLASMEPKAYFDPSEQRFLIVAQLCKALINLLSIWQ
jgi:hypothetical protein